MIRFIVFLIIGYFIYKFFRSLLNPKKTEEKVKGKKSGQANKRNINEKKIEDADFEEVE